MEPTATARFSWRTVGVLLVVLAIVVGVIIGVVLATGGSDTPIGEQSCSELVDTLHDIQAHESPDASFDEQSQASKDAVTLNDRVDELGGCASEPALQ